MSPSTYLQQEESVWYYCTNGSTYCGDSFFHVAKIQNFSKIKCRHDTNANGEPRSVWGLSQDAQMLPGDANGYSTCNFDQNQNWYNHWTDLTQNWERYDLTDLSTVSYEPSRDKTSNIDTTISVSAPAGVSIAADIDHPRIERDVRYDPNGNIRTVYDYDGYAGQDDNVLLGQVSTWVSDRPSSGGDNIAQSYMYGGFDGVNCQDTVLDTASGRMQVTFNYSEL